MIKKIVLFVVIIVLCLVGAFTGKAISETNRNTDLIKEKEALVETETVTDFSTEEFTNVVLQNSHGSLSVPTYITLVEGDYFIVDCYHNQVIFNDNLEDPLYEWNIMVSELNRPHSMASDGEIYVIDDTDNHQLIVMKRVNGADGSRGYVTTQRVTGVGSRPHYTVYHSESETFYVWSSQNGVMYLFRHKDNSYEIELLEVKMIPELSESYVRSFTIIGETIYFVSGNNNIIEADLDTFMVKKRWPVMPEIGGMVQMTKVGDYYYITVSTDSYGNPSCATILRTNDLSTLQTGEYEVIYDLFESTGTPYYMMEIEGVWYLTHHRESGTQIWRFNIDNEVISDIEAIY